jgi:hypothetical protein
MNGLGRMARWPCEEFNAKARRRGDVKEMLERRERSDWWRVAVLGRRLLPRCFAAWRLGGFALRSGQTKSNQPQGIKQGAECTLDEWRLWF